jgi:hypothetical protein
MWSGASLHRWGHPRRQPANILTALQFAVLSGCVLDRTWSLAHKHKTLFWGVLNRRRNSKFLMERPISRLANRSRC